MLRIRFFIIFFTLGGLVHTALVPGKYCEKIDWSSFNSTISVVDPKITEVDKFTFVTCDPTGYGKTKSCRISENLLLQSRETPNSCETSVTTTDGSEPEIWPFITPLHGKFIIPWYDANGDGSSLVLRLTKIVENAKDCQVHDVNVKLRKNQTFKIVPFSDSFDIIYDEGFDEISRKPLVFISKFDNNGSRLGEPVALFAELSATVFDGSLTKLRSYLDLLQPVSPYDSSKGYFFIPLNRKLNQISILSPDGTVTKTADLNVPLNITVLSASNETIVLVSAENNGTNIIYKILQIDSDLKAVNNVTYILDRGLRLLKFENIFDEIVAITSNSGFEWGLHGEIYVEKLNSDGTFGKRIGIMEDVKNPKYNKFEIYKSLFGDKTCINLLFKDGSSPGLKYTCCFTLASLESVKDSVVHLNDKILR